MDGRLLVELESSVALVRSLLFIEQAVQWFQPVSGCSVLCPCLLVSLRCRLKRRASFECVSFVGIETSRPSRVGRETEEIKRPWTLAFYAEKCVSDVMKRPPCASKRFNALYVMNETWPNLPALHWRRVNYTLTHSIFVTYILTRQLYETFQWECKHVFCFSDMSKAMNQLLRKTWLVGR